MREFLKGKERYAAEFLGTYLLGALRHRHGPRPLCRFASFGSGPLGVALAFGLVLMLLVFTLGAGLGRAF